MTWRATLVCVLVFSLCSQPALAQTRERVPRIGFLTVGEPEQTLDPFREGLQQHGYVEGRNIAIEVRFATRFPQRLPQHAASLVASKVDIIVAGGSDSIRAAQRATTTIPIVMAQTSDAVSSGFVSNLARPGGNVTGLSSQAVALSAKRLQLVKELLPTARVIGVLFNPRNPSHPPALAILSAAGRSLELTIRTIEVPDTRDLERSFASPAAREVQALLTLPDSEFFNQRDHIIRLTAQARLPAVHWRKEWAESGGLVSYGLDNAAMFREAAGYVHKILTGIKPGDLAVEQPTKFELIVNGKAAKALGLSVPHSIRLRADQVLD
jgi:putative tryptophan/tyrosine transport system substrate-binding protein